MAADGFRWCSPATPTAASSACPCYGALVTNCDLTRRAAKGLSPARATAARWLHVSAGLGTSPYAPVRFACPPEATLLTLVPRTLDRRMGRPGLGLDLPGAFGV